MTMRKPILALTGLLLALPLQAFAQHMTPNSPRQVLTVAEPVVVGSQIVRAGDYEFQCVIIDGTEYLRVTSSSGVEVARVPCTPAKLASKATLSFYETVPGPGGSRILKSVQLKGDTVAHTVVGVAAS